MRCLHGDFLADHDTAPVEFAAHNTFTLDELRQFGFCGNAAVVGSVSWVRGLILK